ncbi:MAG: FHA domain-containing protein [Acidobacteriota bacterium]
MPTRLRITDDKGFEKVILIDRDVFPIGCSSSSVGLRLPPEAGHAIAARHAVIYREGRAFVLRNETGSWGTRVNGRPVRCKVLQHGDVIRLGSSRFQIEFLVEGTRAADLLEHRAKILLRVLCDLHASTNVGNVSAAAVACVMQLVDPIWAMLSLDMGHGRLEATTAGDAAGRMPTSPTRVARGVMKTARSYFQPRRICAAIMAGGKPLGVLDLGPRVPATYTSLDLELVEALAAHVGVALTNARRLEGLPVRSRVAVAAGESAAEPAPA